MRGTSAMSGRPRDLQTREPLCCGVTTSWNSAHGPVPTQGECKESGRWPARPSAALSQPGWKRGLSSIAPGEAAPLSRALIKSSRRRRTCRTPGKVTPDEHFFSPLVFSRCPGICSAHSNLHPRKANRTGDV